MVAIKALNVAENIVRTNLSKFGFKSPKEVFVGQDGNGHASIFVNFTAAGHASNDVAAYVVLKPAAEQLPDTMKTLSHSQGQVVADSHIAEIIMEAPLDPMSRHAELMYRLQFILMSTYSTPVTMRIEANGVLPAIKGIMGAGADILPSGSLDLPVIDRGFVGGGI